MELFSEIYSSYYRAVGRILDEACKAPLDRAKMEQIASACAFAESAFAIVPRLVDGTWDLMLPTEGGWRAKTTNLSEMPLTILQRSWLRTILDDPRMGLFLDAGDQEALKESLGEVMPLYSQEMFRMFDRYGDGDSFTAEDYVCHFRRILTACKRQEVVKLTYLTGKGRCIVGNYLPSRLEYSPRDDKFRLHVFKIYYNRTVGKAVFNLGRILRAESSRQRCQNTRSGAAVAEARQQESLQLLICNERNGLERAMLHFASYEKRTEYDRETDQYLCTIWYDPSDETELLIRVLSFGPVVKVLGPKKFLNQITQRVQKQHEFVVKYREIKKREVGISGKKADAEGTNGI